MKTLPGEMLHFIRWVVIDAPRKIFVVFSRILILINNEASFFLNIKKLFVPLFGDYSWIGRLMGLVYRLAKIIIGTIVLVVFFVLGISVLILWYVFPAGLFVYYSGFAAVYAALLLVVWLLLHINVPHIRVSRVLEDDIEKSFRPKAYRCSKKIEKLLNSVEIMRLLKRLELTDTDFVDAVENIEKGDLEPLKKAAYGYAKSHKTRYVEVEHVFLGVIDLISDREKFLAKYSLTEGICKEAVEWVVRRREDLSKVYFWQEDYETPAIGGVNRAMTGRVTPALDSVSTDLTEQAQRGYLKKVIVRKERTNEITDILSSSDRANVLIVGPPGCGKTSIVMRIAMGIIKGTKDSTLKFKRIVSIESGSLIAGAKTAGGIADRLRIIMEEASASGDIILFFDEIHNLVVADSSESSNIFSLLEPYFASGKFQIIGATSLEEYRKYIEPNGSFSRLFRVVEVGETSPEETLEILKNEAFLIEKNTGVFISYLAVVRTIELSNKLVHDRVFPDKAVAILGRTATKLARSTKYITSEDIAETISNLTHVPVTSLKKDESEKLLNIEKELKKRVIGQDFALEQVGKALKRARVGMRSEDKPIASFLFVGTTGVGKTETAKALAERYFGDEKVMIRLDMSEYQQSDSINRLIGNPDGSTKGLLTGKVISSPFSLILLDEIEKAHQNVLLAFLQVFDDGRLTDSSGRTVDFTNTIIIATSNVGTRSIQEVSNRGGLFEEIEKVAMKDVRDHFAPEFLNRFNGIIVYKPLDVNSVRKIALLMLNSVVKMADAKGVKLSFSQELIDELIKRGFSPEWGARPLARVIEDTVETRLAVKLLSKEIGKGDSIELGMEVFDESEKGRG